MPHQIIDRRLAGKNKSIINRERILRRVKRYIRCAIQKPVRDVEDRFVFEKKSHEPSFRYGLGRLLDISRALIALKTERLSTDELCKTMHRRTRRRARPRHRSKLGQRLVKALRL